MTKSRLESGSVFAQIYIYFSDIKWKNYKSMNPVRLFKLGNWTKIYFKVYIRSNLQCALTECFYLFKCLVLILVGGRWTQNSSDVISWIRPGAVNWNIDSDCDTSVFLYTLREQTSALPFKVPCSASTAQRCYNHIILFQCFILDIICWIYTEINLFMSRIYFLHIINNKKVI